MEFSKLYLYLLLTNTIILLFVSAKNETTISLTSKNRIVVNGCLILDFNSSMGFVANSCTSMANPDFYPKSPDYTTKFYETGQKLRVGVPKKTGFTEFVNVQEIDGRQKYNVTGFSIDVFQAVLDALPFKVEPEYIPFINATGGSNGTYDELVNKLNVSETPYDAVVGDITIRAHREDSAEFSLPYSGSGVVMVVKAENDRLKNMWIFLKPLSWDLWLTFVSAAMFIGLVLRILEHRVNPQQQLGMLVLFPLAALAFPERNMVRNKWARFVLVVWLFMAYVILQSYTANLSSILTASQLKPSADKPYCAGYQKDTFVKEIVIKMNIKPVPVTSMEEYDKALSKGCKNGGVDAIFDEMPYIKLFLHKYGSKYAVAGPTYSTDGFGFAFRTGSPLLKPISKAILEVTENETIRNIEKRYFGEGYISELYQDKDISGNGSSLTAYSFVGLFTVTAFLTLLAVICSECSFAISRYRNQNIPSLSRVHSIEATDDISPESDPQDFKEVVILGQEAESNEEQLLEESNTKLNINRGDG
ncbi:glutamate receptor 2.5-like [Apium graveolens]|uniref:glutamate receptor 2.5-like n=1 Tax=Apium graveolens TaxID=4045 RepID=UPI003D799DBA